MFFGYGFFSYRILIEKKAKGLGSGFVLSIFNFDNFIKSVPLLTFLHYQEQFGQIMPSLLTLLLTIVLDLNEF